MTLCCHPKEARSCCQSLTAQRRGSTDWPLLPMGTCAKHKTYSGSTRVSSPVMIQKQIRSKSTTLGPAHLNPCWKNSIYLKEKYRDHFTLQLLQTQPSETSRKCQDKLMGRSIGCNQLGYEDDLQTSIQKAVICILWVMNTFSHLCQQGQESIKQIQMQCALGKHERHR